MATKTVDRQAKDATTVFLTRTTFQSRSDADLRLIIKTLREMLLARQQSRAAARMLGRFPSTDKGTE